MNLFNISNNFKMGVQMNIFKDIDYLKSSLMKTYENIYGYDLDVIRRRLKKLKQMKTVGLSDTGIDIRREACATNTEYRVESEEIRVAC